MSSAHGSSLVNHEEVEIDIKEDDVRMEVEVPIRIFISEK